MNGSILIEEAKCRNVLALMVRRPGNEGYREEGQDLARMVKIWEVLDLNLGG